MKLPELVIVVSTAASTLVALAALVVSIVGAVRSTRAAKDAQAARELAGTAQWKMSEHLEAIADAQATIAQGLAVSPRSSGGAVASPRAGGRLSARLVHAGRSHRLVVANVGIEEVEVLGVAIDPPDVTVSGDASIEGVSLDPGEDFRILIAITLDTTLPLTVTMRWRDSRGEQERVQKVGLS